MEKTISDYFGLKLPKQFAGKKTPQSELIGIEVELEDVNHYTDIKPWKTVEDHSLKNKGLEFTLLTWHNNALTNLETLFEKVTHDISSRCSIHVHINVQDLTQEELKVMMLYYMIFERALYKYSGNRWSNIFCVPMRE